MKYVFGFIAVLMVAFISGCSFVDYEVKSSQVAYIYQSDINNSNRANPGSDYVIKFPFEPEYRMLVVDYGVSETQFTSNYTIYGDETRINLPVTATIVHRLKRNPKDDGNLPFEQDEYVKYWSSLTSETINSSAIYNKMMTEIQDSAFRNAFRKRDENGELIYSNFDAVEVAIPDIRDSVRKQLEEQAAQHFLEIVAVRIEDLTVPESIADARAENLRLQQSEINQTLKIEMQLRLAAMDLVKRVREAINDITVDQLIANQVDKGYLMIKVFQDAAAKGGLNASFTPDFLRYIEGERNVSDVNKEALEKSRQLYDTLRGMSNEEMMEYFMNTKIPDENIDDI